MDFICISRYAVNALLIGEINQRLSPTRRRWNSAKGANFTPVINELLKKKKFNSVFYCISWPSSDDCVLLSYRRLAFRIASVTRAGGSILLA